MTRIRMPQAPPVITRHLPDDLYNLIYDNSIRLCVDLAIFDRKKGLLLTRRSIEPFRGLWHLPGGRIFMGETVFDAVQRVAKKETGLDIGNSEPYQHCFLGFCEMPNDGKSPAGIPRHSVSLIHRIELDTSTIELDFQASEWMFFRTLPQGDQLQPYQGNWLFSNLESFPGLTI